MKYTDNYGLKKPDLNDYIEIDDLNENADIVDEKLKEHEDELEEKETPADAQAKADQAEQNAKAHADQVAQTAESNAKQYTDEQVGNIEVPVTSVNNKTGDVTVTKQDVGLGNVTNERQATKTEFDAHKADVAIHKTSNEIRTEETTPLRTEVVSSLPSNPIGEGQIVLLTQPNDEYEPGFYGFHDGKWV